MQKCEWRVEYQGDGADGNKETINTTPGLTQQPRSRPRFDHGRHWI